MRGRCHSGWGDGQVQREGELIRRPFIEVSAHGRAMMSDVHAMYRLKELLNRLISFSGTGLLTALNTDRNAGKSDPGLYGKDRSAQSISEFSLPDMKCISHGSINSPLITRTKFFFGYRICPVCGSTDIIIRGFEGVNQRYHCQCCGIETIVIC
jgi:hypothetical protein